MKTNHDDRHRHHKDMAAPIAQRRAPAHQRQAKARPAETTAHEFHIAAPPSAHARAKTCKVRGAIATSGLIEPPATINPSLAW
jgi:hypothetical protein